jgi:hypothetical protein
MPAMSATRWSGAPSGITPVVGNLVEPEKRGLLERRALTPCQPELEGKRSNGALEDRRRCTEAAVRGRFRPSPRSRCVVSVRGHPGEPDPARIPRASRVRGVSSCAPESRPVPLTSTFTDEAAPGDTRKTASEHLESAPYRRNESMDRRTNP